MTYTGEDRLTGAAPRYLDRVMSRTPESGGEEPFDLVMCFPPRKPISGREGARRFKPERGGPMAAPSSVKAEPVDMKFEVVLLGVSDVDRAKAFYEMLGWRLDIDVANGDFRGVQMTPHNSEASIIFGKGIASTRPGSARGLVLAVHDIEAARADLIARGVHGGEGFPDRESTRL